MVTTITAPLGTAVAGAMFPSSGTPIAGLHINAVYLPADPVTHYNEVDSFTYAYTNVGVDYYTSDTWAITVPITDLTDIVQVVDVHRTMSRDPVNDLGVRVPAWEIHATYSPVDHTVNHWGLAADWLFDGRQGDLATGIKQRTWVPITPGWEDVDTTFEHDLSNVTQGGLIGTYLDVPAPGVSGFHVDSSGNFSVGGTSATDVDAEFSVNTAGVVKAIDLRLYQGTSHKHLRVLGSDGVAELVSIFDNAAHTLTTLKMSTDLNDGYAFMTGSDTFGGALQVFDTSFASVSTIRADLADLSGSFSLLSALSPAALTAQADNYAPTGITKVARLRVSLTGSQNLTGINATQIGGQMLYLQNADAGQTLTLKHNSASSNAGNRFFLPNNADLALLPRQAVTLMYDDVVSRWVAF